MAATLDEAARAHVVGNPVAAVRLVIEFLASSSRRAERRLAYAVAHEAIASFRDASAGSPRLAPLREAADELDEPDEELRPELDAVRDELRRLAVAKAHQDRVAGSGVSCALLASRDTPDGGAFGTAARLFVRTTPGASSVSLVDVPWQSDTLLAGIRAGSLAALDTLARQTADTGWRSHVRIEGRLLGRAEPARGESIGLAAAAATISSLLDEPVSADIGFTGRVLLDGSVEPVGGMRAKVEAAADLGFRRVVVAQGQVVPATAIDVERCRDVAGLVRVLISKEVLAAKLRTRIAEYRTIPIDELLVPWQVPHGSLPMLGGTLLSAVARADPFGRVRNREGSGEYLEDGPILAICRELRPGRVVLAFTTGPAVENDFTANADRVRRILVAEQPELDVVAHPLPDVRDPTDLRQVLPAFDAILRMYGQTAPVLANMTSGTPDMQFAWLLLKARGADLHLVRALESRFAARSSRVRLIIPPPS